MAHGHAPAEGRGAVKQAVLLSTLDQYARGRLPGLTTYRTFAPSNAGLQERNGPMMETSSGRAEFYGTRIPARRAPSCNPNGDGPRSGVMDFFSGGPNMGEEGRANAQGYYKQRPLEGMPSLYRPSATTVYGQEWAPAGITPNVTREVIQ